MPRPDEAKRRRERKFCRLLASVALAKEGQVQSLFSITRVAVQI
jgi:hypothetical protein